jgi:hypothetical protein
MPPDTFLRRLFDLIAKPDRLMRNVGMRPRWWQAGILVTVIVAATSWLTMPITISEGVEQLSAKRDAWPYNKMPDDQWEQMLEKAQTVTPQIRAMSSLRNGIVSFLLLMILGFILGFFAKMSNGKGTPWQAVGIVAWSNLIPLGLAPLIKAPLVIAADSSNSVSLGLAAFTSIESARILYVVLSVYGDFATWWGLALMVIGFSRVFGLERKIAVMSVVLPWAILSVPLVFLMLMAV